MNNELKTRIRTLINNEYAETGVSYHAEYRNWHGQWQRGCYAQIAAPMGGTIRIYAPSYAALLEAVETAQDAGQF